MRDHGGGGVLHHDVRDHGGGGFLHHDMRDHGVQPLLSPYQPTHYRVCVECSGASLAAELVLSRPGGCLPE